MARGQSNAIRAFILDNVGHHGLDIASYAAKHFRISRQAVYRHLAYLSETGQIEKIGDGPRKQFILKVLCSKNLTFDLKGHLEEDRIWVDFIKPALGHAAKDNVYGILRYGFTGILNNAIDHSEGTSVRVALCLYPNKITIIVSDDGVGVFQKIQEHFELDDPRHALLELSKGKITSDPERHTGEGIFFTSRMFDWFSLESQFLAYIRHSEDDWLIENRDRGRKGTKVVMEILKDSNRTTKGVFEKFASEANDYGFSKTHVPVNLATYEGETLVSRSQAKRLMARVDRFREVILDFRDVKEIGPAFSDEIFRVFAKAHPTTKLYYINAEEEVEKMIRRASLNERNA